MEGGEGNQNVRGFEWWRIKEQQSGHLNLLGVSSFFK
jgi:hypothetical protein